jgi:hypothetical protein
MPSASRARALALARRARTRSIASRYSGLARIDRGRWRRVREQALQRGVDGLVGRRRVRERSGLLDPQHRSRAHAPEREARDAGGIDPEGHGHRREVVAAPPRPPLMRARDPRRRDRQLHGRDELPAGERRDPERTKNASSAIRRSPSGPDATTVAPWTSSAGAVSAAGEALQRFPASVARFRICTEPTTAAPRRPRGTARGSPGARRSRSSPSSPRSRAGRRRADPGRELRDALHVHHE